MFAVMSCVFFLLGLSGCLANPSPDKHSQEELPLRMPGLRPEKEDYYACTSFKVEKEQYITQYSALADAGTAHHILLYGCESPASNREVWTCGATCRGMPKIMFAWAKNANPTSLPKDVGFHVGGSSGVNYLVLQVHYARTIADDEEADKSGLLLQATNDKPRYTQGILLMVSGNGVIPPNKSQVNVDISCKFDGDKTIHPFAFRTHAHGLSYAISGYKLKLQSAQISWEKLGKGNPQWPQAFYPMETEHTINPGDYLAGRCMYNSTNRDHTTYMGEKHTDEMCNFYMMFYMEGEAGFYECGDNQYPDLSEMMPAESLQPLPPNPALDSMAHSHHHHGMHTAVDEPEEKSDDNKYPLQVKVNNHPLPLLSEANDWYTKPDNVLIGQIAGLDVDSEGNVVVFHRGSHVWGSDTFNEWTNTYNLQNAGPITDPALIRFDASSRLIDLEENAWGENQFYLPHGITIDNEDNIWLTDVALHQVFKYNKGDKSNASITLGEPFKPGNDEKHFCKPTDVAVRSDGNFFVADGYCNSRIVMFNPDGNVIRAIGDFGYSDMNKFNVPHSLAISMTTQKLCVADRENSRTQCFDLELQDGHVYDHKGKVFGVAFKPDSDKLVAIEVNQEVKTGHGRLFDVHDDGYTELEQFDPANEDFAYIHDVAVSKNGDSVYVAQLDPPKVWKFGFFIKEQNDEKLQKAIIDMAKKHTTPIRKPIVLEQEVNPSELGGEEDKLLKNENKIPIIVAIMFAVPLACVVIILGGFKVYNYHKAKKSHNKFNMGTIFNGQREDMAGFSPLTAQEDHYTDTEDENENNSEKKKILPKK